MIRMIRDILSVICLFTPLFSINQNHERNSLFETAFFMTSVDKYGTQKSCVLFVKAAKSKHIHTDVDTHA